jgi:phospholipid/cholesterol/gamma-HCH transport system permease protein
MANVVGNGVRRSGNFFAFCLDALRGMAHRPLQWREFVQQAWFISSVSILPAALVSIPFGAVISLQLGSARSPTSTLRRRVP